MSRFEFVKQHSERFEVEELCEALDVSRSGYYRWALERRSAIHPGRICAVRR